LPAHGYRRGVNCLRLFRLATHLLLAGVLGLCVGVRLLTPAGFMPSFAHGSLAIVECPEADGAPPQGAMPDMVGMDMPGMAMPEAVHHDGKHDFQQSCPYAQAASLAAIELGIVVLAILLLLVVLPSVTRALPAFSRRPTRDRPPSHGPPFPV